MIEKEKIMPGVVNMFEANMGLKSGEKVLVVAPTVEEWIETSIDLTG